MIKHLRKLIALWEILGKKPKNWKRSILSAIIFAVSKTSLEEIYCEYPRWQVGSLETLFVQRLHDAFMCLPIDLSKQIIRILDDKK